MQLGDTKERGPCVQRVPTRQRIEHHMVIEFAKMSGLELVLDALVTVHRRAGTLETAHVGSTGRRRGQDPPLDRSDRARDPVRDHA